MQDKPLVSVVTVAYNAHRYIRDAIESVLAQEYDNIEYIIGDDCSTDETWSIIQEYHDPRIRAYRNESNLREYPNRNKAIDLATGKYLIFIDGDDIIFPHGIGFFVSMMESFPEAALAIQKNYYNNLLFPALMKPEQTLRNNFYRKFNLLTSSFASDFFKTEILKKWKLPTNYISGDEEIRLKIAMHYPVLFVAGWVSWPRETPGQASSRISPGRWMKENFQYTLNILSEPNKEINEEILEDMRAAARKRLARFILVLIRKRNFSAARELQNSLGFSWTQVMKYYRYKPVYNDTLDEFTPSNPYRNGFLRK